MIRLKAICFSALCLAALAGESGALAQQAARKPLAFEVASVRENKTDERQYTNFPLSPGPQFSEVHGQLVGRNVLLLQYVIFAVRPTSSEQMQQIRAGMPDWARGVRYDINAKADGDPTKDEMREMLMTLLAERFQFKAHHESHEAPVFALTLVKPGRLGPKIKLHPADDPDCKRVPLPKPYGNAYPAACGGGTMIAPSAPGLIATGGQNVTVANIAVGLSDGQNNVQRRVIDGTGLTGGFDFSLEWMPETAATATAETPQDAIGPTFIEALKDQLGMKLVSQKALVDVVVIDRIEHPTEN